VTQISMYEMDGGPSGIWWEGYADDVAEYLGLWTQDEMLDVAKILNKIGHQVRFYTQAEYELNTILEDA
jgi:hypothetical protein